MLVDQWSKGEAQAWSFFSEREMGCRCADSRCNKLPDPTLMRALQDLRRDMEIPLPINSGARCPRHNAKVSRTGEAGPHTTGLAVDIGVRGDDAVRLLRFAMAEGIWTGFGISQRGPRRFIHLDMILNGMDPPRPMIWSY